MPNYYTKHPDDPLIAARVLLQYLRDDNEVYKVALYPKAIEFGQRLIDVQAKLEPDRRVSWSLRSDKTIAHRLELAGIAADLSHVVDWNRYGLAMAQLRETNKFNKARAIREINRGAEAPAWALEPLNKVYTRNPTPFWLRED